MVDEDGRLDEVPLICSRRPEIEEDIASDGLNGAQRCGVDAITHLCLHEVHVRAGLQMHVAVPECVIVRDSVSLNHSQSGSQRTNVKWLKEYWRVYNRGKASLLVAKNIR